MSVTIDLRAGIEDQLRCVACGEWIDAQGNDPWDLLLTSHYCPHDGLAGEAH
jgi:hypothetical protein